MKTLLNRNEKAPKPYILRFWSFSVGGDKRDRTADLLNAIQALSQLSYTPIFVLPSNDNSYYIKRIGFVNSFFKFDAAHPTKTGCAAVNHM